MRSVLLALLLSTAATAGDKWQVLHQPDPWVLMHGGGHVTMSGNFQFLDRARSEAERAGTPVLWFQHEGREYIVRDPKLIQRITEATKDDPALQAEEARLEKQEETLDRREEDLEEKQEDLEDRRGAERERETVEKALRAVQREKKQVERAQRDLERRQDAREKAIDAAVAGMILGSIKDGTAQKTQ